jgi:hypothetical protein
VTFPAVTSLQFYLYVADGYGLAFFMACLSAFFLTRKKARPILASLLLTLSVAIYQAYLTVTVTLLLLFLFTELFFGKESVLALFRRGLLFLLSGAASVLAYYGILFLILRLTGQTLLEYQGVSSGFSPSSFSLAASFWNMGKTTLDFFFDFSQGIAFFPVFNLIFFGFTALILLGMVFTAKPPVARCLLSLLFLFLLPVGGTLLALLNAHVDYHMLMKMGFLTPYLIPLLLYEKGAFSLSWERVKRWSILLLTVFLVFCQVVLAAASYHKAQLAYEKSYGVLMRLAHQMEQTPKALSCEKLLVVGALPGSEAYSVNFPPDVTGTTDSYLLRADDESVGQSILCSALNDYIGTEFSFLAGEEKAAWGKRSDVAAMPVFPEEGSVAVKEDILIIKLSEEK